MGPANPSNVALLIVLPLLAWRVYSRMRRMVGRQRLSPYRPWVTLTVFPLVIALLCLSALAHPERLLWMAGGLGAGALLGRFGLRHTRFESAAADAALYYTPNAHLGIALSLLLAVRVVYRVVQVAALAPGTAPHWEDFTRSPLTLAVFGLLAGYYVAYAVGLLRWRAQVRRAPRAAAPAQPSN
jgi:hypothetical protein